MMPDPMASCAWYRLLRPLLFRLSAETSHHLTFALLRSLYRLPGAGRAARFLYARHAMALPVKVMGLQFPNPVGLAAGLDKNAGYVQPLADFGFGFLELGTVTPRPQPGNPKPRLFRLTRHAALINRMGFNNAGIDAFLANLARAGRPCPIGINIGKNRDTSVERAVDDYLIALRAAYARADYIAVNISSPNTAGLRDLQNQENLEGLLSALKAEQSTLAQKHGRYVPVALKIAPDLDDARIAAIAALVRRHKFDAVIATNTTVGRPGLNDEPTAREGGGLSGRPLKAPATEIIRKLFGQLRGDVPIIGVGGVETAEDAWEKLVAGADLIQIYTALIYRGPCVAQSVIGGLAERMRESGQPTLAQAVALARRQNSGNLEPREK